MKKIFLKLIRLYKKTISPIFGLINPNSGCRFYPSCSQYMYQAIEKYGIFKGLFRGLRRLIRCNPLNRGGYDPC